MAKYRITAPDGGTYEVTAPDDASEADVLAYAQANYQKPDVLAQAQAAPITDLAPVTAKYDPTEGMTSVEIQRAAAGRNLSRIWPGIKQAATSAADYFLDQNPTIGNLGGNKNLTSLVTGHDGSLRDRVNTSLNAQYAQEEERRQLDAPLMAHPEAKAADALTTLATIVGPGLALRGTTAGATLLPRTLVGNAAQGAAVGAIQPAVSEGERAGNTGLGAALPVAGSVVAKGLNKLATAAKVPEHVRAVYEAAKARGIELTPGQLSDSRFMKWTQSMLRSVPFTGAQGRYDQQVGAFNRQLAKTIGEDAPVINSQVYGQAKARQSAKFEELTSRNALKVDDKLLRNLSDIADSAKISPKIAEEVDAAIDSLYARATTGPGGVVIPGEAYQAFDSELGQIIKAGGSHAHFIGNVQSAVRRAMDASISPEDAGAWKALRTEYGNRKKLTALVAGANDGPISPARVQAAVTSTKSGKESVASGGGGDLATLGRIGQRMKEPPSSGTAERLIAGGIFNPINWPYYGIGGTAGLTAGRLVDSKTLTKIIMRQNPGMTSEAAAKFIARAASPAGQVGNNQRQLPAPPPSALSGLGRR